MCKHCNFTYSSDGEKITCRPIKTLKSNCQFVDVGLWRHIYDYEDNSDSCLVIEYGVQIPGAPKYAMKSTIVKIKYCPFCGEKL